MKDILIMPNCITGRGGYEKATRKQQREGRNHKHPNLSYSRKGKTLMLPFMVWRSFVSLMKICYFVKSNNMEIYGNWRFNLQIVTKCHDGYFVFMQNNSILSLFSKSDNMRGRMLIGGGLVFFQQVSNRKNISWCECSYNPVFSFLAHECFLFQHT